MTPRQQLGHCAARTRFRHGKQLLSTARCYRSSFERNYSPRLFLRSKGPMSMVAGVTLARKCPKCQRLKNAGTKCSMFGQHSTASTGGFLIRLTVQIANIFAIVCRKFGATPFNCRRRRGVAQVVYEQCCNITLLAFSCILFLVFG